MFKTFEINKGINLHYCHSKYFKTTTISIFITTELTAENVTKTALLAEALRGGTKSFPSISTLEKKLETIWGSVLSISVSKKGSKQIINLTIEGVPSVFCEMTDLLYSILFNNCVNNQRNITQSKNRLTNSIDTVCDDKIQSAYENAISALCKSYNHNYYLNPLGNKSELSTLTHQDITNHLYNLLTHSPIDVYVVGKEDEDVVTKQISNIFKNTRYDIYKTEKIPFTQTNKPAIVTTEEENTSQGRIVMIYSFSENVDVITAIVLNNILGGGGSSLLFNKIREKENLCYSIGSSFIKEKNLLVIESGVDSEALEKTSDLIADIIKNIKNLDSNEFEKNKNALAKTYDNFYDLPIDMINFSFSMALYETETNIDKFKKKIIETKIEDVISLAKTMKLELKYFMK